MEAKEINALIALLDDPDKEVFTAVSSKIVNEGTSVVHLLEKAWEASLNELVQQRIESLIHSIQLNGTIDNFSHWISSGAHNLLEGAFYLSSYQYPEADYNALEKSIEKIRKDVWIELNENLTALEKVKILNHIIYDVHGFTSNTANFFAPQNNFINQVIETKKGGPITLAILYSVISQKLGLPIYAVNLPKNFILAYKDRFRSDLSTNPKDSILFYINPFNRGAVLGHREIEHFLNQQNIEQKDEFYIPCSNLTTISQLINSLIFSYEKMGNHDKLNDLSTIQRILLESKDL